MGIDSGDFLEDAEDIPSYVFYDTCFAGPSPTKLVWYYPSDFGEVSEKTPRIVGRIG